MDTEKFGMASVLLGAGRLTKEDSIDFSAGIVLQKKVGDYVNRGDVLGITGSTGNSTGPHLHFEVTENGVRINPLSHGAEPRMGYLTGYTLSGTSVGS